MDETHTKKTHKKPDAPADLAVAAGFLNISHFPLHSGTALAAAGGKLLVAVSGLVTDNFGKKSSISGCSLASADHRPAALLSARTGDRLHSVSSMLMPFLACSRTVGTVQQS